MNTGEPVNRELVSKESRKGTNGPRRPERSYVIERSRKTSNPPELSIVQREASSCVLSINSHVCAP